MKIILTNDDGIDAPGLAALERVCQPYGDLVVAAPHACHSSMSHRITTTAPIHVTEESPNRFRIEGTPADCTRLALTHFAPDATWVIAGINRGANLGADTYSSGTVAAAREAALLGCPAVAISQYVGKRRDLDWSLSQHRAMAVMSRILQQPLQPGQFWNINLPHPPDGVAGYEISYCPLDYGPHAVHFECEGEAYLYSADYHQRPAIAGHDVAECFSGKITATLMSIQPAQGHLAPGHEPT